MIALLLAITRVVYVPMGAFGDGASLTNGVNKKIGELEKAVESRDESIEIKDVVIIPGSGFPPGPGAFIVYDVQKKEE